MEDDEPVSLKTVIGITLVTFLCCLVMLAVLRTDAGDDITEMIGHIWHREEITLKVPEARAPVFESEYDFEAYYAAKAVEEESDGSVESEAGDRAKKRTPKQGRNRRAPALPDGLQLGNSRVVTSSKSSRIEIIDIGGSMEPVDIYEETGARMGRAAPGSIAARTEYWPMPNRLHHAAESVPSGMRTYQAAAQYIGRHESNDVQRVKAIHDFITLRLTYDYDSLKPGRRKSQQPKAAFDSGLAVCEGYARLFKAMAGELGLEAAYITGLSRQWMDKDIGDQRHAWNAVKIDGTWHLIDVTWGDNDQTPYDTDYLFVPPEVLGATHFPTQTRWQLRKAPLSRAAFYRGAHLRPAFHAEGLDLVSPTQGQVNVVRDVVIEIDNPAQRYVSGWIRPRAGGENVRCDVTGEARLRITCPTKTGRHTVALWAGSSRRSVKFVAALHVTRR